MPFFFYTFLKAEKISILKKHLYVRRKHEGSITESVDSKFLDTVPAGQILMEIFIEKTEMITDGIIAGIELFESRFKK